MNLKPFIFIIFLLSFCLNNLYASDLDSIIVTADRIEGKQRHTTVNVTVLDSDAIQNSSVSNLAALLKENGFQVNEYGQSLSKLTIRGLSTDLMGNDLAGRVLILLNGRRIGTGNASLFSLSSVDRVEIIKGPAASQYGSSAMGGVVNIITKRGKQKYEGFGEAGLGSYNLFKSNVFFSGAKNGFDFSLAHSFKKRGDYNIPDGRLYKYTRYEWDQSAHVDMGYTLYQRHRIGVDFNFFGIKKSDSADFDNINNSLVDKTNYSGSFNYTGSLQSGVLSWEAGYSLGRDEQKFHYATDFSLTRTNLQTGWGILHYNSKLLNLTGGVDGAFYDIHSDFAPERTSYSNRAAYIISKFNFLDEALTLSISGRYDTFTVKDKDNNEKKVNNRVNPSLGVSYSPIRWFRLRGNYAQAYRVPTPNELFYKYAGFVVYEGNPNLRPEKSVTWEAGADISNNFINASTTYFNTVVKDMIRWEEVNSSLNRYTNIDKAFIEGVEFNFSLDMGYLFQSSYEISPYIKMTNMIKIRDDKTGDDLAYVAREVINYGIVFNDFYSKLMVKLNVSYSGREKNPSVEKYGGNKGKVEKYTVADFIVKKGLESFNDYGDLFLNIAVNNIFNEYYDPVANYPAPGRNFYFGITYDF